MNPVYPMCGDSRTQGSTTFTVDPGIGLVGVRHVPALIANIRRDGVLL